MSETKSSTAAVLRTRPVLISLGVGLLVVLVWLMAFFLPQGKDLTKYQAQQQQLQAQQSQLQVRLAQLRATSKATPRLLALQAQFTNLIPPTADIYNYINLMSSTAAASGVQLVSITPSGTGTTTAPGTSLEEIPVSLVTTGSYDSTLRFIKAVYNLPRLTVIDSMTIAGGGPGTNRGTSLSETFSLTIYTSQKPSTP